MAQPLLIIVGGSNGAGKSTFAVPYAKLRKLPFLNADVLTKQFAEAGETQPLIKAARAFLTELEATLQCGESICIETTLSGAYIHGVVSKAKALGYRVELVYLFLRDVNVAIRRVANRVMKGGHDVPVPAIRRRFAKSITNFERLRDVVDHYRLFYSDSGNSILVREFDGKKVRIFNPSASDLFDQLSQTK